MGKPDVAHDDNTCHFLQLVKRQPLDNPPTPETDSSDDESYQVPPQDNPPGPYALHHGDHDHVTQENLASPPPPVPARPSRAIKPPARYSPSPRERKRRQSNAKFKLKQRAPEPTKVKPMITFQGRRWGPPVDAELHADNTDDEITDEESGESDDDGARN